MQFSIDLQGMDQWFGGDHRAVLEMVELAERLGVEQVCLPEHVAIGEDRSGYPFGEYSAPLDAPWLDPLIHLGAIAARTTRIRLNTGVLLTPLRPAVLLAKQLATLDVLSHGRLEIGVGTGWHRAEHEACHSDFEQRAEVMYEQMRVCRTLWRDTPASFAGKHHHFDRLHTHPKPVQADGVPIWFGVPPGERNFKEIAEIGHGWMPLGIDRERTARGIARLRELFAAAGRDAAELAVSHILLPAAFKDELGDIEATIRSIEPWRDIGITVIRIYPAMFLRRADDLPAFIDRFKAAL